MFLSGPDRQSELRSASVRDAEGLRIKKWPSEPANLLWQDLNACLAAVRALPADQQGLADGIGNLLAKARSAFTALPRTTSASFSSDVPALSLLLTDTLVFVWTTPSTDVNNCKTVLNPISPTSKSVRFRSYRDRLLPSRRARRPIRRAGGMWQGQDLRPYAYESRAGFPMTGGYGVCRMSLA
jgi:hypothetical protein